MFIQCLGSGDAFASGGKLNSSFYVRTASKKILLDCGASVLIALKKQGLTAAALDVIIISHLHGDHFGGLAFVLCEMIAMRNRTKPLTIIGPVETETRTIQVLESLFPGVRMQPDTPVAFITYTTGKPLDFEDIRVTAYRAVHSETTNPHCIRLQAENKIIAFSGDTEWTDELIRVSMNADLFICEGSTWTTPVKQHMSISQLLAHVHRMQVKRIVLTHLGPEALSNIDQIPLPVAEDGMVLLDE